MKPPPFEYAAPQTLDEAVALLREKDGEAKVLSGGQSLMPLLNMRLARPELLVDLARVPGLDFVRFEGNGVRIGAMTRQRTVELSAEVRERHPLLYTAVRHIAHPQNRNQGTVGGSLAHADPAAELPALATLLDARMHVIGPEGERTVGASEFFVTYLTTCLDVAEILTGVEFPLLEAGTGWSFQEVARRHGDFALAGAIATAGLDSEGRCRNVRLALFGVADRPLRMKEVEASLEGERADASRLEEAARAAAAAIEEPLSDVHATAEYRRDLARVMARRALAEAVARAGRS